MIDIAKTGLQFLGLGVFVAVLVFWVTGVAHEFSQWVLRLAWQFREAERELERRKLGQNLAAYAHWFCESPEAMEALKVVGQDLADSGRIDDWNTREKWRRLIAGNKTEVSK